LCAVLVFAAVPAVSAEESQEPVTVRLYADQPAAAIGDEVVMLDTPAALREGDNLFVPVKFVGDTIGIDVRWNEKSQRVEIRTATAIIEVDIEGGAVYINGAYAPLETVGRIVDGRLMVTAEWLNEYFGVAYTYDPTEQCIEFSFVQKAESPTTDDGDGNSKPVALFTFGKPEYRIGEPVEYIDLSYDPDAEGLKYEWTGREEAFFKPGRHLVSLRVIDSKGKASDVYSAYVRVVNEVMYPNELDMKLHTYPAGSLIKTDWNTIYAHFNNLPVLPVQVTENRSRALLMSDSPETFKEKGVLYADKVNGKARLYAHHMNGMDETVQFVIMATNLSNRPVKVRTTNKGEVSPSIYANLLGHQASVEFLLNNPHGPQLTIPPGETQVYAQMRDIRPGYGINVMYDVETDGPVEFSFIAMDASIETPVSTYPLLYKPLPFDGHVRGTFNVTEKRWDVDLSSIARTSRLVIGDGKIDPFQEGYDVLRRQQVKEDGNYGVVYKIHAEKPRKMAVLLQARGGPYKGPFKINGKFVLAPESGVLTAFDGVQILARTDGTEPSLDIEFIPPAGSAFPINLIFYPLK
jgi:hypothetical protein